MEVVVTPLAEAYAGRRVLVTGHTGFKGTWLSRWLVRLGADVAGFALPPDTLPSLFALTATDSVVASALGDVRDLAAVRATFERVRPEIVFHLAAQPLVRRGYTTPVDTIATNVLGTTHVLECCRDVPGVRAVVVVTSDKCYENREQIWAYREIDPLGGREPYGASKAAAEIVTAAYRESYLRAAGVATASARAGNVVGGGDWAEDRLLPDIVRAAAAGAKAIVRNPDATRPWQHVLDAAHGYLLLGAALLRRPDASARAWNFGPSDDDERPTALELASRFASLLGRGGVETAPSAAGPYEARALRVDSTLARAELGWRPRFRVNEALEATAAWYRAHFEAPGHEAEETDRQIAAYPSG